MPKVLTYEQWYDIYGEEITIRDAETGADREMDYDMSVSLEVAYEEYLGDRLEEPQQGKV